MGDIVKYKLPCTAKDSCGSSDAMVMYSDGGKYCHGCQGYDNSGKGSTSGYAEENAVSEFQDKGKADLSFYHKADFKAITDRRIDVDTCKKYGVKTNDKGHHLFPRHNKEGELIGVKVRLYPSKEFRSVGDTKGSVPFGMQAFPKTGRSITVTEGEYDAMAAFKMTGSKYPNISIWDGAGSAKRCMKDNFEEMKEFESIIINFDADKPGREATQEIGPMFPGRTKVMELTEGKDACDYLKANKTSKYVDEFHRSKRFTLGGLINGADAWDKYSQKKDIKSMPFPKEWVDVNSKTYGLRLGEIVLFVAGTGVGKTQVLREMKYHYLRTTKHKMLDISLEEDIGDSLGGILALHVNKRILLPDVHISKEEEKGAFDELFSEGRMLCLDHEGSLEDDSLLDKVEYAASVEGCKIVWLDHLTLALADAQAGSENSTQDSFMNKLLKMVKRLNICVVLVSHLRKTGQGKTFEEGLIPTEDTIKGSGSTKQIAMTTIAISRNKYAETEVERNTTQLHVLKCRFSGRTGPCDHLFFEDETGRMIPIDPEEAQNAGNQFEDNPLGY